MNTPPTAAKPIDSRGWRAKFAVLGPSTNTIVQPDMDDLRLPGVTAHYSRIFVTNMAVNDEAGFKKLTDTITAAVDDAVDSVLTCEPDYIVMGMSAITFYGGVEGAHAFRDRIAKRANLGISTGAISTAEALHRFGAKRVAFLSPYFPSANAEVRRFYTESGFEVTADECLQCESPVAIAQVPEARCREVLHRLNASAPDAIVQVGTNLSMQGLAAAAEHVFGKPVIAINAATWWHALRAHGIPDSIHGHGRLLETF
jgi:maleate isomerase